MEGKLAVVDIVVVLGVLAEDRSAVEHAVCRCPVVCDWPPKSQPGGMFAPHSPGPPEWKEATSHSMNKTTRICTVSTRCGGGLPSYPCLPSFQERAPPRARGSRRAPSTPVRMRRYPARSEAHDVGRAWWSQNKRHPRAKGGRRWAWYGWDSGAEIDFTPSGIHTYYAVAPPSGSAQVQQQLPTTR